MKPIGKENEKYILTYIVKYLEFYDKRVSAIPVLFFHKVYTQFPNLDHCEVDENTFDAQKPLLSGWLFSVLDLECPCHQ